MSKASRKVKDIGPYMINEKMLGESSDQVTAIVIDNVISRENRKTVVKPIRTSNPDLWIGAHTVAVFRVKKHAVNVCPEVVLISPAETGIDGISVVLATPPEATAKVVDMPARKQDMSGNVTGLFVNYLNQLEMKRSNRIYRDPGTPQAEGEQAQGSEVAAEQSVNNEAPVQEDAPAAE